ncbi:MBL fold metallo-hydrolase [Candidatus Bathyarchaeota archaeon]|nr:MBL fold metallo-hydrolase [Candidatus Bathyarchaeota archaeon]
MSSLTFYGGVDEIGGNKILLDDKGTRVMLDFGMSFNQSGKYFSEFLQPRKCNCLEDFIAVGLLPKLKGIYREDYIKHARWSQEERGLDAVLITHAHADHAAFIHHLRKDVPIYVSPETKAILNTLEVTGSGGFKDFCNYSCSFEFKPKKDGSGYTKIIGEVAKTPRSLKTFNFGEKFKIDSIEVTPYEVDHSLPGSTAFLIYTSQGNILYTGDYRFHGYRSESTISMVDAAIDEGVDILITEGTRVNEVKGNTEQNVFDKVSEIVKNTKELTLINFPSRDTARLKTFQMVAKEVDKKLVLDLKQAYLLNQLSFTGKDYPSINDQNLCFFAEKKNWGLIGRDDYPQDLILQDYDKWERAYLEKGNVLNFRDIKSNQREYMFYCNYFLLNELIDIKPNKGSRYIRSVCEPFDEEMNLDEKRVQNWLNLFKIDGPHQIHASGHASGPEIFKNIDLIQPKKIIPIHTESTEYFNKKYNNTINIEVGKKIIF